MEEIFCNRKYSIKVVLSIVIMISIVQSICAQEFEEKLRIPWNTKNGINTELFTSSNRGLLDFEMVNNNTVALLCDVEHKVKIFDISTDSMISEFYFNHGASSFSYDRVASLFYITDYDCIYVYCADGSFQNKIIINKDDQYIPPVVNTYAYNQNFEIQASNQFSYTIIKNGNILSKKDQITSRYEGWKLNDGTICNYTGRIIDGVVKVNLFIDNETKELIIKTGVNSIGIDPVGKIDNLLVLTETYVKGNEQYNFYQRLVLYSLNDNKIVLKQEIPRICYTYQKRNIKVFNNKIYQLITTPDNARLLEYNAYYSKTKGNIELKYPNDLNYDYHYNFHLMEDPKEKEDTSKSSKSGINTDIGSRQEVLNRAYRYVSIQWNATKDNFPLDDVTNKAEETDISTTSGYNGVIPYNVWVPDYVSTTETNKGMPYKWYGWTHYNCFNYFVRNGKITGDITSGNSESTNNNVIGTDCS
ncbi:MAG: hypothetical protein M0P66_09690, partial [Salinivirgaceae bacterium]|nr:hypothetical protein [Salinivirgaceae bacterium]